MSATPTHARPRNFDDDWTAPGSPKPPGSVANPMRLEVEATLARPAAFGAGFRALDLAEVCGPAVDARHGIDLSPDGADVAFAWDRSGTYELYVVPLVGERIYQLTDAGERSLAPRWSPDGRSIAFLRGSDGRSAIWLVDRNGKRSRELAPAGDAGLHGLAWSPDGAQLAAASGRGIELIDAGSGERRVLAAAAGAGAPAWSPDGGSIAFSRGGELCLVSAADGRVSPLGRSGSTPRWAPDGTALSFTSDAGGHTEIALARLAGSRLGAVELLTNTVYDASDAVWRPDGRGLRYLQAQDVAVSIRQVFAPSHADTPVADLPGVHAAPRVGPDSETTAFVRSSPRSPWEVWVRAPRSIAPRQLTVSAPAGARLLVDPVPVRVGGIPALVFVPYLEATAGRTPPVIVHPWPRSRHLGSWDPVSQWLAHRGYVVIVPQLRGDESDAETLLAALNWLDRRELGDGSRAGLLAGAPAAAAARAALAREPDRWMAAVIAGEAAPAADPRVAVAQGATVAERMAYATEWLDSRLRADPSAG